MTHHMALHNDVLGRIHTILNQDDYFRTLEELLTIVGPHAYDGIQLFPELFDMPAVIERITSEADLIGKQLNRSSMYPLPQTPLPSTSCFIPRPNSTLHPIMPAAPSPATGTAKPHQTQQSQESSPGSSLPCRQGTPTATSNLQPPAQQDSSTSSQGIPTKHSLTHSQFTPQGVAPQTSPIDNHLLEQKITRCLRFPFQLLRPRCPTLQKRRYQNHSMERESRIAGNKPQCLQLIPKAVDSSSDVNSQVT